MPKTMELEIGVFEKGSSTRGIPAYRIDTVGAQYFVDCGFARWVSNRYNSIIMLVSQAMSKARDRSAAMGYKVTLTAVGIPSSRYGGPVSPGAQYEAMAMVNAWGGTRAAC